MASITASYSPSAIGYSLDIAASILSWPSSLVLGKQPPEPIWTTKYILAMHYSKETQSSTRLYKDITDAYWTDVRRTVARVFWAASLVLPVLGALAWCVRYLAKLDSAVASSYELAERSREIAERERQFQALGDSVREFAGFLCVVGCKKELDEGLSSEELLRARQDGYRHFCTHFTNSQPKEALLKSAKQILELLQSRFNVDYSREDDLKACVARAFLDIQKRLQEGGSCDFMMGEKESALYPAWECLTSNYDRFYQLCQNS